MYTRLLTLILILAPLAAGADEKKPDWTLAAARRWEAEAERWKTAPPLPAEQAPVQNAKGVFLCPADKQPMVRLQRRGPGVKHPHGLFCDTDHRLYHVAQGEKGLVFRGPLVVHIVTREAVKQALSKHMTDANQQGFYANRFKKLQAMGPETAPHLLDVYNKETDEQIRALAIDALGEVGNKSVAGELEKIARDQSARRYVQSAIVALHRLGKPELFNQAVTSLTNAGQDLLSENKVRGEAYSSLALLWSRLDKQDKAMAAYQQALKLLPDNQTILYNIACHFATIGKPDEAFKYLNQSVDKGFDHWEWIRLDGDLKSLHKDPRWKKLLERQKEKKKLQQGDELK